MTYTDIVYDSRSVKNGDLFCAVKGFNCDGNNFVDDAVKKGAVAILSENDIPADFPVEWIKCKDVKTEAARICKEFYGINFEEIFTVATTGTNGKTSIATICHEILAAICGAQNSILTSTVENRICGNIFDATRTTPEAIDTLKMIANAPNKIKTLSMEASSHALVLGRMAEFYFNLAIFTNLTQDHLDFHKTMQEYYQAKKLLFTKHLKDNAVALINIDDEYGNMLFSELQNANKFSIGFSKNANYQIMQSHCSFERTFFKIKTPHNKILKFYTKLIGHFNVINCAQAVCGLIACGFDDSAVANALSKIKPIQGRMEIIAAESEKNLSNLNFNIIIDYAHTPDALVKVLSTVRKLTKGNIICVFGAGGNRDRTKRPLMAQAVAANCDFAVLTGDNPRNEDPESIINDVKEGFVSDFPYTVVPDRKEAIAFAINSAHKNDTIIIAGKGHEKYQEINGVKYHFDDKEIALSIIRNAP
jgi:UDP-N-acetylmuramoyl-L-alanyl-D-glutamate--2,6-diaminopimelate ligase